MALSIRCMGSFDPLIAPLLLVQQVGAEPSDENSERGGLHERVGKGKRV